MKTYQGTMKPSHRDLSDSRSSVLPTAPVAVPGPRRPVLNDRRSTR
jgi:hypothetical protein